MSRQDWMIAHVTEQLHQVSKDATELLLSMGLEDDPIYAALQSNIAELDDERILRIAVVGQYSAGKSTLISAVTGNRAIRIDADIATDVASDYEWNGILLTDTPGLYTDRSEHDALTEEAIRDADLLVFVITSDLFDDVILQNFVKMAYDEGFQDKMLLVVNKMSMESGSFDVLVENYQEALAEAVKPHDFCELETSFIDAADYIEGLEDEIPELVEMSHFSTFTSQLNHFVERKGLLGKLDRPVRFAMSELQKVAIQLGESESNRTSNVIFDRIEKRLQKSLKQSERLVEREIRSLHSEIVEIGNGVSSSIGTEHATLDEAQIQGQIRTATQQVSDNIRSGLEEEEETLRVEITSLFESEAGKAYIEQIRYRKLDIDHTEFGNADDFAKGYKLLSGIVDKVGVGVFKSLGGSTKGLYKAGSVSGSNLHKAVYKVGKFFGAKFKPWQAAKIAKGMGNFMKALGVMAAVGGAAVEIWQMYSEHKEVKKILEAKQQCVASFAKISRDIEPQIREAYRDYCEEFYYPMLRDIADERDRQIASQQSRSESEQQLMRWIAALKDLTNVIGSARRKDVVEVS